MSITQALLFLAIFGVTINVVIALVAIRVLKATAKRERSLKYQEFEWESR